MLTPIENSQTSWRPFFIPVSVNYMCKRWTIITHRGEEIRLFFESFCPIKISIRNGNRFDPVNHFDLPKELRQPLELSILKTIISNGTFHVSHFSNGDPKVELRFGLMGGMQPNKERLMTAFLAGRAASSGLVEDNTNAPDINDAGTRMAFWAGAAVTSIASSVTSLVSTWLSKPLEKNIEKPDTIHEILEHSANFTNTGSITLSSRRLPQLMNINPEDNKSLENAYLKEQAELESQHETVLAIISTCYSSCQEELEVLFLNELTKMNDQVAISNEEIALIPPQENQFFLEEYRNLLTDILQNYQEKYLNCITQFQNNLFPLLESIPNEYENMTIERVILENPIIRGLENNLFIQTTLQACNSKILEEKQMILQTFQSTKKELYKLENNVLGQISLAQNDLQKFKNNFENVLQTKMVFEPNSKKSNEIKSNLTKVLNLAGDIILSVLNDLVALASNTAHSFVADQHQLINQITTINRRFYDLEFEKLRFACYFQKSFKESFSDVMRYETNLGAYFAVLDFFSNDVQEIITSNRLDLSWCRELNDLGLTALAIRFPNLNEVRLFLHHQVTDTGLKALAQHCPRLVNLQLIGSTQIGDIGLIALAQHCPNLTHLGLGSTQITDTGLKALAQHCTALTDLALSCCSFVTDSTLTLLATNFPHLMSINLHGCSHITDAGLTVLAAHRHNILDLNLNYCSLITDASLIAIAAHCPNLVSLSLDHDLGITDRGLIALAGGCRNLRSIALWDCHITDVGVTVLAQGCPNLNYLNLSGCNNVAITGLTGLCMLGKNLTAISLHNCNWINRGDLQPLKNRYPNINFSRNGYEP